MNIGIKSHYTHTHLWMYLKSSSLSGLPKSVTLEKGGGRERREEDVEMYGDRKSR